MSTTNVDFSYNATQQHEGHHADPGLAIMGVIIVVSAIIILLIIVKAIRRACISKHVGNGSPYESKGVVNWCCGGCLDGDVEVPPQAVMPLAPLPPEKMPPPSVVPPPHTEPTPAQVSMTPIPSVATQSTPPTQLIEPMSTQARSTTAHVQISSPTPPPPPHPHPHPPHLYHQPHYPLPLHQISPSYPGNASACVHESITCVCFVSHILVKTMKKSMYVVDLTNMSINYGCYRWTNVYS